MCLRGGGMRLSEFKERYKRVVKREYTVGGKVWHAKSLCYCRKKVLEEEYDEVASKDAVMVGQLVHIGVDKITGYDGGVYVVRVGDYIVKGTPDLYKDGELVEVKFTMYPPKEPREHDVLQLKIYMWMLGEEKGYLWYLSPTRSVEFEIEGALTDEEVLDLIENPRIPFWEWECKYCSVYDCEMRRL